LGRKVAHGAESLTAQSEFCRKKQSSQDTLHDFLDTTDGNSQPRLLAGPEGPFTGPLQKTSEAKRDCGGQATAHAAKRCLFVPIPQTPPFDASFSV
jgi:hypothetical protein